MLNALTITYNTCTCTTISLTGVTWLVEIWTFWPPNLIKSVSCPWHSLVAYYFGLIAQSMSRILPPAQTRGGRLHDERKEHLCRRLTHYWVACNNFCDSGNQPCSCSWQKALCLRGLSYIDGTLWDRDSLLRDERSPLKSHQAEREGDLSQGTQTAILVMNADSSVKVISSSLYSAIFSSWDLAQVHVLQQLILR